MRLSAVLISWRFKENLETGLRRSMEPKYCTRPVRVIVGAMALLEALEVAKSSWLQVKAHKTDLSKDPSPNIKQVREGACNCALCSWPTRDHAAGDKLCERGRLCHTCPVQMVVTRSRLAPVGIMTRWHRLVGSLDVSYQRPSHPRDNVAVAQVSCYARCLI